MKTIKWTEVAAEDFAYWKSRDPAKIKRIQELLKDIQNTPFSGIGKPEPLRHLLSGKWSRRITQEHRLVYEVTEEAIIIHQCRFHYTR